MILAQRFALASFFVASMARCECVPEEVNRRAIVQHDGSDGIWFPIPVAKCILSDLTAYRSLIKENALVLSKVDLLKEAVKLNQEETKLESEKAFALERANEVLQKKVQELTPAWYEHPGLLLTAGIVFGSLGAIAIFSAAK